MSTLVCILHVERHGVYYSPQDPADAGVLETAYGASTFRPSERRAVEEALVDFGFVLLTLKSVGNA